MAHSNAAQKYLETEVKTKGKERLLLMLFDGAIRFSREAKECMAENDIEGAHNRLIRGQRIMLELIAALDEDPIPEDLYDNLIGLYDFIYNRLVEANTEQDPELVDEALEILEMMKETWEEAVDRMQQEEDGKNPDTNPDGTPGDSSLSISG